MVFSPVFGSSIRGLTSEQEETLEYITYEEPLDRLIASKPFQTTEDSLYYGYTLKSNIIGQEVGYEDLISGRRAVNPYRIFNNTTGTMEYAQVTRLEDISSKPDNGFEPFQPIDADTLMISEGNPLVANFTNITTAFVSAQRVRGLSGKMTWKIESPDPENIGEFLVIFDGMDYDFFADFDNPNTANPNEFEIFYPFDVGYRENQVLRLTFFSYDGNPVQVLGDNVSGLPYFSTRFQNQIFERIYSNAQTKYITTNQDVLGAYDYEVDTSGGVVTLTVPSDFVDTFKVSDVEQNFGGDDCIIDFSAFGQGSATLDSNRDMFKFYYDGTQWRYKNLRNGRGGIV